MTDFIEIKAAPRDVIGKSSRRLYDAGVIPAVLYGHDVDPTAVSIDRHNFEYLMTHEALASTILKVEVEGVGKPVNAIVKEIQKHPVNGRVQHVDIFAISLTQKIHTAVPISIVGESAGVEEGGIITQILVEVDIEALPTNLPDAIEADISQMGVGDTLHAGDLVAPEDVVILTDPASIVLSITLPRAEEEEPEEGLELEEGAEVPEIGEEVEAEAAEASEEE